MPIDSVESALREHWPPQNVIVECGVCGYEMYNVLQDAHKHAQPPEISAQIHLLALEHKNNTNHTDVQVNIIKEPEMKKEIDVTINVGDVA